MSLCFTDLGDADWLRRLACRELLSWFLWWSRRELCFGLRLRCGSGRRACAVDFRSVVFECSGLGDLLLWTDFLASSLVLDFQASSFEDDFLSSSLLVAILLSSLDFTPLSTSFDTTFVVSSFLVIIFLASSLAASFAAVLNGFLFVSGYFLTSIGVDWNSFGRLLSGSLAPGTSNARARFRRKHTSSFLLNNVLFVKKQGVNMLTYSFRSSAISVSFLFTSALAVSSRFCRLTSMVFIFLPSALFSTFSASISASAFSYLASHACSSLVFCEMVNG